MEYTSNMIAEGLTFHMTGRLAHVIGVVIHVGASICDVKWDNGYTAYTMAHGINSVQNSLNDGTLRVVE